MDDGNRRQKERRKFREIMGLIRQMDFGNWGDKVLTETGFFELQRGAHSG